MSPASSGTVQQYYESLARSGQPVLQVDSARSLLTIEVRRTGTLAQFGHDHVVASRSVRGYLAPGELRADIWLPLRDLTVDEPDLRRTAGFTTQPSPSDIAGTRENMLNKVLRVDDHPLVEVRVTAGDNGRDTFIAQPSVTLNGITRTIPALVTIAPSPEGLQVTGEMSILQSDFGLTPFSILGGAIKVDDALAIRFALLATGPFEAVH